LVGRFLADRAGGFCHTSGMALWTSTPREVAPAAVIPDRENGAGCGPGQ
jgi:hypothetical protein